MYYEVVSRLIREKGLTIAEVERMAGLGNGIISKWKTLKPKIGNLEKVASVLGISVTEIVKECEGD